jgi:hypothetical protein
MWGRSIGAFFYVPAAYFWIRGCLSKAVKKRVAVAGVLLACQGLLGTFCFDNHYYFSKSNLDVYLKKNEVLVLTIISIRK